MSTILDPCNKPRPVRLPPYFYILVAIALLAIPRPLLHLPTSFTTSSSDVRTVIPDEIVDGQSVETLSFQNDAHHRIPPPACGHIVLVSAARHGSTWLIDSAEGCTSINGSYGTINRFSELWNDGQEGPLRSLRPSEAADYAERNHSIKIFPPALTSRGERSVEGFFRAVKLLGTPVFVLRRRLEDCYGSLAVARETRSWNTYTHKGILEDVARREIVKDEKWYSYYNRMQAYFADITNIMKKSGVVWDELRYEDVIGETRVMGKKNGCYVKNCNFRRR